MFDIFKSLAETCTIYEFIDFSAQSHAKGELKEKSLIALFGHSSLLNKQLGGFYNDYASSGHEKSLFLSLDTHAFERLEECDIGAQYQEALQFWTARMQALANSNPDSTGTNGIQFSDAFRNQILNQGLPTTILETFSLLVFIGEHAPMLELINAYGFWAGKSAATNLLKSSLSRLST